MSLIKTKLKGALKCLVEEKRNGIRLLLISGKRSLERIDTKRDRLTAARL